MLLAPASLLTPAALAAGGAVDPAAATESSGDADVAGNWSAALVVPNRTAISRPDSRCPPQRAVGWARFLKAVLERFLVILVASVGL